jgi:hypothetical protein
MHINTGARILNTVVIKFIDPINEETLQYAN